MSDTKEKREERRKQEQRKKKRSLHRKHKERRKRDCIAGMPFIIAFQGDPAADFRCEDMHRDMKDKIHYYHLNPIHGESEGLMRLNRYKNHKITRTHMGQVLVYKAG